MSAQKNLQQLKRFTTANSEAGKSVFLASGDVVPPSTIAAGGLQIFNCYSTDRFPVRLINDEDLLFYENSIQTPPATVIPTGSALRIVDFPPSYTSPMHRTISVNFNVVIEGEVELILDSGEARILRPGDSAIQRAVNHAWRNVSATKWARIVAVPLPAEV